MFTASLTDFKQAFLGKQVVGDASMFFCAPDAVIRQEIEAWALMPLSVSCEWHTKRFQGVGEIQWGHHSCGARLQASSRVVSVCLLVGYFGNLGPRSSPARQEQWWCRAHV